MSELFGLDSTYSAETLERRARWRDLQSKPLIERGHGSELEADILRQQLGITPSDEVVRALNELDQQIELLRD